MNKNTKQARAAGFVNKAEQHKGKDGVKVFKGKAVQSSWPDNGKINKKVYPKSNQK